MSEESVEIARRLYAAFQGTDFEVLFELLSPKIEVVPDPRFVHQERYHGHDGFVNWVVRWYEPWDEYRIDLEELIDAGDKVIAVQQDRGEGGPGGMAVEQQVFTIWTFEGDQAVRMEFFFDRSAALEAAGLSE